MKGNGMAARNKHGGQHGQGGFTLIEILIVVVLLGILAAIAVPKLSNATTEAKENMLRENVRVLKAQIGTYRAQHWDIPPGYPDGDMTVVPTSDAFVAQLTQYTDEYGSVNATKTATFKYGPYMREMPENPINKLDTVEVLGAGAAFPAADDSHGWVFSPSEMILQADVVGVDTQGTPFSDY